jgi:uncharacterized protein YutE (UPF0331/DUF86 family)
MGKREELNELYFECGAGLYDSQTLEYNVSYLIYLLSTLGFSDIEAAKAEAIIDGESKQTIGQMFRFLKDRGVTFSPGLEQQLQEAIAARNQLIHHYFINNIERIANPTTRPEVVKETKALRKTIRQGEKALRNFLDGLSELSTGISPSAMKEAILKEYGIEHWEQQNKEAS